MTDPARPFFFENRLQIYTFIRQRVRERGHTPSSIAHSIGAPTYTVVSQLLSGRQRISRSKYFDRLCDLLDIIPPKREDMRRVEQQ